MGCKLTVDIFKVPHWWYNKSQKNIYWTNLEITRKDLGYLLLHNTWIAVSVLYKLWGLAVAE